MSFSSTSDRHENLRITTDSLRIRHHNGNYRQMEVEATRSLLMGVFSMILFVLPTLLLGFTFWGCQIIYGKEQDHCSNIRGMIIYTREILLGYLVYNPIKYIMESREFKSTIRERRNTNQNRHLPGLGGARGAITLIGFSNTERARFFTKVD